MEKALVFDDDVACDTESDLVSLYLFGRIKELKPEWFEQAPLPPQKRTRRKKMPLKGNFNLISVKLHDPSWEDDIPGFVAFEKTTRVYQ